MNLYLKVLDLLGKDGDGSRERAQGGAGRDKEKVQTERRISQISG